MKKNTFLFLGAFVAGALITLTVRAHRYESITVPTSQFCDPLSGLASAGEEASPRPTGKSVNTFCAICGMDVDPALPTATYQGKTIGFGCRTCPPKFAAHPNKYGPAYLRNERAP